MPLLFTQRPLLAWNRSKVSLSHMRWCWTGNQSITVPYQASRGRCGKGSDATLPVKSQSLFKFNAAASDRSFSSPHAPDFAQRLPSAPPAGLTGRRRRRQILFLLRSRPDKQRGGAEIMSFVSLMDVENPSRLVRFPMNYASGIKSRCRGSRLCITERSTPPSTAFVLIAPSGCLWRHLNVPSGSAEPRCRLLIFIYRLHAKKKREYRSVTHAVTPGGSGEQR